MYFLTPLDFWRMQTKRLPQKGSLWRTSRNFEKPHTIGTSCYAGPIEISSRTPSTWIRLSPLTFGQKTRKPFHNMRWIFPQMNMLAHHVQVESVKDPIGQYFNFSCQLYQGCNFVQLADHYHVAYRIKFIQMWVQDIYPNNLQLGHSVFFFGGWVTHIIGTLATLDWPWFWC